MRIRPPSTRASMRRFGARPNTLARRRKVETCASRTAIWSGAGVAVADPLQPQLRVAQHDAVEREAPAGRQLRRRVRVQPALEARRGAVEALEIDAPRLDRQLAHQQLAVQQRQPLHVDPYPAGDDHRRVVARVRRAARRAHGDVVQRQDRVDRREAHVADVDVGAEDVRQPRLDQRAEEDRQGEAQRDHDREQRQPALPAEAAPRAHGCRRRFGSVRRRCERQVGGGWWSRVLQSIPMVAPAGGTRQAAPERARSARAPPPGCPAKTVLRSSGRSDTSHRRDRRRRCGAFPPAASVDPRSEHELASRAPNRILPAISQMHSS